MSAEKSTSMEVIATHDSLHLVKINEGHRNNLKEGQYFDIIHDGRAIANAKIIAVKPDESILSVVEYMEDQWIDVGDVVQPHESRGAKGVKHEL